MPETTALSLIVSAVSRLEEKLDRALDTLSDKADRTELEQLRRDHHDRLTVLEDARKMLVPRLAKLIAGTLIGLATIAMGVAAIVTITHALHG